MNIEDAKQLAKQGDREGAIALLRQMLEQNEGERELVLLELGVVYNAMGETTQAINHLNEVMRINPENTKAKAYLESLSEKQKRGILIAMLVFTCVASGIVLLRAAGRLTPARERMELPFGEGSLSDTLRRLPDPLKGQETNIYRTIKQPQQNGKQEK